MNKLLSILSIALVAVACSDPDVCFTVNPENYKVFPVEPTNCSDELEYGIWDFGDGYFSESVEPVDHFYGEEGNHSITYTTYSPDGRRTASQTESFYVGYKRLKTITVEEASFAILLNPITGDSVQLRLMLGGVPSNEIMDKPKLSDFPFTFTFPDSTVLRTRQSEMIFLDYDIFNPEVIATERVVIYDIEDYSRDVVYEGPFTTVSTMHWEFN